MLHPAVPVINRSGFDAPKTRLAISGTTHSTDGVSHGASRINGVRSALCPRKLSRLPARSSIMSDATSIHDEPPRCRLLSTPVGADVTETADVSDHTGGRLRPAQVMVKTVPERLITMPAARPSSPSLLSQFRSDRGAQCLAKTSNGGRRASSFDRRAGRDGHAHSNHRARAALGRTKNPYAAQISADCLSGPVCRGQRTDHAGRSRRPARGPRMPCRGGRVS